MRPLEERRARALIEQAVQNSGATPAQPRKLELAGGKILQEDLAIDDGGYGIAYITANEARELGDALPAVDPSNSQLRLVPTPDGTVILVLYEQLYRYDAGDDHTTNIVTAENTLKRDVSDFVLHVVKQGKAK